MAGEIHILLADSDTANAARLRAALIQGAFQVTLLDDGQRALDFVAEARPDVIVLGMRLASLDGLEVCRRLRRSGDQTPLIIHTHANEMVDRWQSLEAGADLHLAKPCAPEEIIGFIHALLERTRAGPTAHEQMISGDLVLDRGSRTAELRDQPLTLSPMTWRTLEYLMAHADRAVSREELLTQVWGWDRITASHAVDEQVRKLRAALGDNPRDPRFIRTVFGHGYHFIAPVTHRSRGGGAD